MIDNPAANNRCPAEGHLVALVIAPGIDFQWYRKGRTGRWTHKPGPTLVINVDNSNAIITVACTRSSPVLVLKTRLLRLSCGLLD